MSPLIPWSMLLCIIVVIQPAGVRANKVLIGWSVNAAFHAFGHVYCVLNSWRDMYDCLHSKL